ncbi:MAG: IS4 family transposase [Myxococcota bacterium]|nr:IS4 family transposase [Myxococcota bacterium]
MARTTVSLPFEPRPQEIELEDIDLGDKRLDDRARLIFGAWSAAPESSLPRAMKDSAQLEGAYRFFNNPRVDSGELVAPHVTCSWQRAVQASASGLWVLAIQDTTEMRFGGTKERDGLGELMNDGEGFYAHTGLLACMASAGEQRDDSVAVPLGLGGCEILVRPRDRQKKPSKISKKQWERARHFSEDNEFLRWDRLANDLEDAAREHGVSVVHVADREADEYSWMANILSRGGRFVIRQTKDRRLLDPHNEQESQRLEALLGDSHPIEARHGRSTTLGVHALTTTLCRPDLSRATEKTITVNVVIVRELDPPDGQTPIEWRLLTTESIESPKDVLRVVDAYRARWLIEEYFKAIKTGCGYERLQLESLHGLKIALSFCFAIAWHMLLLRTIARDAPNVPARAVMTASQMAILLAIAAMPKNPWSVKLDADPDATAVLYAVARMGGHLKNNGPPGWMTLSRGFQELRQLVLAQRLFAPRSDQS